MRQHPAAVGAVLERAEEEVDVRADPAVEGVAVGRRIARLGGSASIAVEGNHVRQMA